MATFRNALREGSLAALRRVPKSDLHNHAYAGGNREWVAREMGHDIAPLERPLNSMSAMHAWVDRQFGSVFAGPNGRLKAFEATFVQARYDGVTFTHVGLQAQSCRLRHAVELLEVFDWLTVFVSGKIERFVEPDRTQAHRPC